MAPADARALAAWGERVVDRIPLLRSMRARAIAVVVLVVLLPLALVAASSWVDESTGRRMAVNVREAADEIAVALARGEDRAAAAEIVARRHDVRVRVLDTRGDVAVDLDRDGGTHPLQAIGMLLFGADGAPTLAAFDETLGAITSRAEDVDATNASRVLCRTSDGARLYVCSAARRTNDGVVYVQESSRRPVRALYDLRYQIGKLAIVMLPVALLLAWWLGWRTVRPIEELRRQVLAKAAVAAPGADLSLPRRDEIGDLAAAFNGLLHALDDRRAQNERFVADLVHEMKNPVAAIRASAEALGAGDTSERAQRLARVLDESSTRLDALVTQLLELARAEAGMPSEARGRVDVASLARGIVASLRSEARWPVAFEIDAPDAAAIDGVEHRLEAMLRNLLENAASFAKARVCIRVRVDDTRAEIDVEDDGPGILAADLPRVFDRFFTTRGRAHGTGLGLALVRAIVDAHGGSVRAESSAGGGATFRVALPRAR